MLQFNELINKLQQYLPFTVLKLAEPTECRGVLSVATVLTVYGIETLNQLARQ